MRDLQAQAGPGTGRVPTCYLCDTPTLRDLNFKKQLTPRSHRAESLEEQQVSTLVCRTYGWDPQNRTYRAATGPQKKCLTLKNIFQVFWSKVKSRPALPNRANPLACTLGSVGVCHARPQGPGRARDGPGSDVLPLRHPYFEDLNFKKTAHSALPQGGIA